MFYYVNRFYGKSNGGLTGFFFFLLQGLLLSFLKLVFFIRLLLYLGYYSIVGRKILGGRLKLLGKCKEWKCYSHHLFPKNTKLACPQVDEYNYNIGTGSRISFLKSAQGQQTVSGITIRACKVQ